MYLKYLTICKFIATRTLYLCAIVFIFNVWNPVSAANSWSFGVTPQLLAAQYRDSTLRDSMTAYGLFATADYLEQGNIKLGYNFTSINGKSTAVNGNTGKLDIDETSWYLSGRYVQFFDAVAGKIGFRLDGYDIQDQSTTKTPNSNTGMGQNQGGTVSNTLTDDIGVIYAQLDYMNYAERFYADVGIAYSDYDYELNDPPYQDNTVQQLSTAAGLAINNRFDWLQTRFYFIRLEHGNNTGGDKGSAAVELKWLHWFQPNAALNIHSIFIKFLAGERWFAVDPDATTTYSIADKQTNSAAAGLDWKIGERSKILLLIGYDQFENPVIDDKYSSIYGFGSLSLNW